MSGHKRIKTLDYDDDDLEDYDDDGQEDQLSAEDQERMRQAVSVIRAALGKDYDSTVAATFIEETLYYYYYDTEKSLDYIKKHRKPASAQPQKQNGAPEPSPDDVVRNAQAKGQKQPKKDPDPKPKAKDITQGVAAVKIDDVPKVKSKNIDVVAEYERSDTKKAASFVVVGHVDHGKSTLMGRLLYDLKHIDERSYQKMQKSATEMGKGSFAFAWAMDSTEDERERGITVDVGTNTFETAKTAFTILDAPGHKDFIPNMIAGASQADFAVLVVDASTNAFEAGLKGQTREHALLVRALGIARVVVAVNKMDAAGWAQDRFDTISQQLGAFLASAGFAPANTAFVPCAGLTGGNVAAPPDPPPAWYTGGTLVDALDAAEPARRAVAAPLRLTVSDASRAAAPGVAADVSVTGRVDAGSLQAGTAVLAQPAGEAGTVKSVTVDGAPRDYAHAGQLATVALVGIEPARLRSGDVLCERGPGEIRCARAFTARCLAFEHVVPGPVDVYRGRLGGPARIAELLELVEKEAKGEPPADAAPKKRRPRVVKPGQVVRLRVVFEQDRALPLEPPDRVVLRSEGNTIAAGLLDGVETK